MKYRLCLVALTLAMSLMVVQPVSVLAADTQTEEVDQKGPNDKMGASYEAALDKWNKLSDAQKQEVYAILKNKQKADMEVLDKLASLGVIEKTEATVMKAGLEKIYKNMIEKGQFPIMKPHRNKH